MVGHRSSHRGCARGASLGCRSSCQTVLAEEDVHPKFSRAPSERRWLLTIHGVIQTGMDVHGKRVVAVQALLRTSVGVWLSHGRFCVPSKRSSSLFVVMLVGAWILSQTAKKSFGVKASSTCNFPSGCATGASCRGVDAEVGMGTAAVDDQFHERVCVHGEVCCPRTPKVVARCSRRSGSMPRKSPKPTSRTRQIDVRRARPRLQGCCMRGNLLA